MPTTKSGPPGEAVDAVADAPRDAARCRRRRPPPTEPPPARSPAKLLVVARPSPASPGPAGVTALPLGDREGAESGRRRAGPRRRATRLRIVIAARSGAAAARRPAPSALADELVDAPALQELGLAAHGIGLGQLVEGDVGGDVLIARRGEVPATAFVAPVGAQPRSPRQAGAAPPWSAGRSRRRPPGPAADRLGRPRPSDRQPPASGARAPWAARRGSTAGNGSNGVGRTSANVPSPASVTNASRQPPSWTASRNGRLSSSSLARTTPSNGPAGQVGPRLDAVGVARPLRRGDLDGDVRAALLRTPGRAASTARASVPGPAPASTTVNGSGRPRRSHSASRKRATHGAEQRPDLGRGQEVAAATGPPAPPAV